MAANTVVPNDVEGTTTEHHIASSTPGQAGTAPAPRHERAAISTSPTSSAPVTATPPPWSSVLAVVAHPDDESLGLGAVLESFARAGTSVTVLCLTHGAASTRHGISGDLTELRAAELRAAASELGVPNSILSGHPNGRLDPNSQVLVGEVVAAAANAGAEGLVVFDPSGVTGHPDHVAATTAALHAADNLDLPVLGWTIPAETAEQLNAEFDTTLVGQPDAAIDIHLAVDRSHQLSTSLAYASQAIPTSLQWRCHQLLGDAEHLRWLRLTDTSTALARTPPTHTPVGLDRATVHVDHHSGDRFDITIGDHTVTVDQPVDLGGADTGPTPTELFVASLASCVGFYTRRHLARHNLDPKGLSVEASYTVGTKPARVTAVQITIHAPAGLPEKRREALVAVAGRCTLHNSMTTPPAITLDLADD
jgi:N-acetylglucosamine malate deacetylase 2